MSASDEEKPDERVSLQRHRCFEDRFEIVRASQIARISNNEFAFQPPFPS